MVFFSADEVQLLVYQVQGASFALSLMAGVLVHRGHFCTMGAISDWVLMRDATRLRQWALAVAVAAAGFGIGAGGHLAGEGGQGQHQGQGQGYERAAHGR